MISLLVVNYRTSQLAVEAIRSARAASSAAMKVIVVDNSCDAHEAETLRGAADVLIVSEENRGYAAAINAGRSSCEGDAIIVTNPDVTFFPSSIDQLVSALDSAAAAGPAIFWDSAREWRLPPGDLVTAWEKIDQILASRSRLWFEQRDRRRILARAAFWSQARTVNVAMLSGAVMAIRPRDFDDASGFDERFPLYFEENDFLRRLQAMRKHIAYVPAAHCRHIYNQSAAQVASEAATRFAVSEAKYLEKWNGPFAGRLLKRLERPLPEFDMLDSADRIEAREGAFVIELSPLPSFSTAAGRFSSVNRVAIPREILETAATPLYARTIDRRTGTVLETYRIRP